MGGGGCENLPFSFLKYLYIELITKNMKPEYKEKALENINGVHNRIKTIKAMMEGTQPANQQEAIRLAREIEKLLELTSNIVDLA